jgi:hypothetical protein
MNQKDQLLFGKDGLKELKVQEEGFEEKFGQGCRILLDDEF